MVRGGPVSLALLSRDDADERCPGRHTAGNNTFSYFTTPSGFAVEYTAELEDVDFETHEPQVHEPGPQIMDQWGVGTGGPQTMPKPAPDPCLFQAAEA